MIKIQDYPVWKKHGIDTCNGNWRFIKKQSIEDPFEFECDGCFVKWSIASLQTLTDNDKKDLLELVKRIKEGEL